MPGIAVLRVEIAANDIRRGCVVYLILLLYLYVLEICKIDCFVPGFGREPNAAAVPSLNSNRSGANNDGMG